MFLFQIITNLLIGGIALFSNYFVLKYYWISRHTLVSMLYSAIAIVDSVTASVALLQIVSFSIVEAGVEKSRTSIPGTYFGVYCYIVLLFFSVTSRVSCFLNALLAVTRAIAVWKPFYRIAYRPAWISIVCYSLLWITFMIYVGVHNFFLDNPRVIRCSTVNQCLTDLLPPDLIYGVPYILPTVIVMGCLFLTLWAIRRSKGFMKSRTVQEQTAVRNETMSRTTRTIIIISVVFLICNVTFAVFGAVMWLYTNVKNDKVHGDGVFMALFFFAHFTVVYLNAAINPVVLIYRSSELSSFTIFSIFEVLHIVTCGLVKKKEARTNRESRSVRNRTTTMECQGRRASGSRTISRVSLTGMAPFRSCFRSLSGPTVGVTTGNTSSPRPVSGGGSSPRRAGYLRVNSRERELEQSGRLRADTNPKQSPTLAAVSVQPRS